jgi:hypothetical protein
MRRCAPIPAAATTCCLDSGKAASRLLRILDELRGAASARADPGALHARPRRPRECTRPTFGAPAPPRRRFFDGSGLLLQEFRSTLERSLMGTRLYVAGPESFIGLAMKIALGIQSQQGRDSRAGVRHARAPRALHPLPRNDRGRADQHRALRRLRSLAAGPRSLFAAPAAYMGVMVDAEAPGELPPIKEVFL